MNLTSKLKIGVFAIGPLADYFTSLWAWSKGAIEYHSLPLHNPLIMLLPFPLFTGLWLLAKRLGVKGYIVFAIYCMAYVALFAFEAQSITVLMGTSYSG